MGAASGNAFVGFEEDSQTPTLLLHGSIVEGSVPYYCMTNKKGQ